MASIQDDAVVLRRLDYSESSQVLALLTRRHGKVRAIAKGIKRSTRTRFAPAIDLLETGRVVLSVRDSARGALSILTEWKQTAARSGIRNRLDRLYAAQYAAGLVADLTEDWDAHPELFDAVLDLFTSLESTGAVLEPIITFQRRLLVSIGSQPVLDRCIGCGRPMPSAGPIHFCSLEGGLVCRDCESARAEKRMVERGALRWLSGSDGDKTFVRAAYETLNYHLTHLIGRPPALGAALIRIGLSAVSKLDRRR